MPPIILQARKERPTMAPTPSRSGFDASVYDWPSLTAATQPLQCRRSKSVASLESKPAAGRVSASNTESLPLCLPRWQIRMEHKGASLWRVLDQVNVREKRCVESSLLGSKQAGENVHGRRVGDWIRLADEPGFMVIYNQITGDPLLEECTAVEEKLAKIPARRAKEPAARQPKEEPAAPVAVQQAEKDLAANAAEVETTAHPAAEKLADTVAQEAKQEPQEEEPAAGQAPKRQPATPSAAQQAEKDLDANATEAAAASPARTSGALVATPSKTKSENKCVSIDAKFIEWLEERPAMLRMGAAKGLGWEFPLSSEEKKELVMLSLAGETLAQRDHIEKQCDLIHKLQDQ